ncbi:MAG: YceI family protein [Ferruginibacter sp.]
MSKLFAIAFLAFSFTACNSEKNTSETIERQDAAAGSGATYSVDSSSTITWVGSKPTGRHTGIFQISEGLLMVADGKITSGKFVIDMASLANKDLAADPKNQGMLEGHLKSPDFFDVTKYPTSGFEITSISPVDSANAGNGNTHMLSGNLTLKDSTKNVTFPAKVTVDDKSVAASATFPIDRTNWGLNYKGPNNPQDWVISKTVNISLDLRATKK